MICVAHIRYSRLWKAWPFTFFEKILFWLHFRLICSLGMHKKVEHLDKTEEWPRLLWPKTPGIGFINFFFCSAVVRAMSLINASNNHVIFAVSVRVCLGIPLLFASSPSYHFVYCFYLSLLHFSQPSNWFFLVYPLSDIIQLLVDARVPCHSLIMLILPNAD